MTADGLEKLKDIHLPSDVSWWPLAWGWWVLFTLFLSMMLLAIYLYWRSQRKSREELIIAEALYVFHNLVDQPLSPQALLMGLSALLRRTAMSLYGREISANLSGKPWLEFLNEKGFTKTFTEGVGQAFGDQPYRETVDYNRDALLGLTRYWLQKQLLTTVDENQGATHA